jgi:hypothetical protein
MLEIKRNGITFCRQRGMGVLVLSLTEEEEHPPTSTTTDKQKGVPEEEEKREDILEKVEVTAVAIAN